MKTALEPCKEVKNLGLTFDRTLSWDAHVSMIRRRCMGMLAGLSHVRHYLPDGVITTLVSALVLSQVRYCLTVSLTAAAGRQRWGHGHGVTTKF